MHDWSEQEVRDELYNRVINTKGTGHQLVVLIEELSELIQAVTKYKRSNKLIELDQVICELADVEIMIEQLKLMIRTKLANGSSDKLNDRLRSVRNEKLNRLSNHLSLITSEQ